MVVKIEDSLVGGVARLCVGIGSVSVALEASLTDVAFRDSGRERSTDQPTIHELASRMTRTEANLSTHLDGSC